MAIDIRPDRPHPGSPPLRIGISGCLLGLRVRYDGGDRLNPWLTQSWADAVHFIPFCPETECGLGVPREPMRLEGDLHHPRLRTLHTGLDHTHQLCQWCQVYIQQPQVAAWSGVLLKSRSPSCGLAHVPVLSGETVIQGMGIFARLLQTTYPALPMAEGDLLQDEAAVERFYDQVSAFARERV